MIRATTGGVLKSYRFNLMNSFIAQNKARDTVLSQRTFNSYAEDPAAAAKAFRLRKSRMTVESQYDICSDTTKKYETAYSCLQSVDEVLDTKGGEYGKFMKTLKGATLTWLNDPTGDAREQLTKAIDEMSEMLVQTMNQKYGDNFIFAGADGHNVPFEVRTAADGTKDLYYRGVPVDAMEPKLAEATVDGVTSGTITVTDPADNTKIYYVLDSAEKIPIPDLMPDAAGTGLETVTDTVDGTTQYYLQANAAAPIQQADYDALSRDEQATYTAVTDSGNNTVYYKTLDLVDKQSSDDTYANGILKDDTGAPYFMTDESGNRFYISSDPSGLITKEDYDKASLDAEKLKYLADEKYFVDIGLGFKEDENGNLLESSGFNAALNGINFLGYGLDEDGDPKNLYSLVQRMKEISDSVSENISWNSVYDEFHGLVSKFEKACSNFKTQFTNTDANTTKLQNQGKLLEDNFYNLQEQYAGLEDVDMVESIESFLWAEYAYNAALKVGNSVLGQSLMDYLS